MGDQRDEAFEAILEQSSLGSSGARLLRARTSPAEAAATRELAQPQDCPHTAASAPSPTIEYLRALMGVAAEAQTEEEPPAPPEHSTGKGVVFLTVTEVATVMRVSRMTVYRLVHSGALPAIRVGRSFRMPEQAVHDYLKASFKGSLSGVSPRL
ncbi:DNA binding domain-containing protein, excisionase family [Streptomyces sp. 2323.1]|nr:DNA binding domain-containing protein, excisionase family [Streptomyces sp. 2323.1]